MKVFKLPSAVRKKISKNRKSSRMSNATLLPWVTCKQEFQTYLLPNMDSMFRGRGLLLVTGRDQITIWHGNWCCIGMLLQVGSGIWQTVGVVNTPHPALPFPVYIWSFDGLHRFTKPPYPILIYQGFVSPWETIFYGAITSDVNRIRLVTYKPSHNFSHLGMPIDWIISIYSCVVDLYMAPSISALANRKPVWGGPHCAKSYSQCNFLLWLALSSVP